LAKIAALLHACGFKRWFPERPGQEVGYWKYVAMLAGFLFPFFAVVFFFSVYLRKIVVETHGRASLQSYEITNSYSTAIR
jgi:hypothetical protein